MRYGGFIKGMEKAEGLLSEHIQALGFGLVLMVFSFLIASKSNFFQLPRRAYLSKIPLSYTLGAFFVYLAISMVLVPLAAIGILSHLKGELFEGSSLSSYSEAWINVGVIFSAALGLAGYLSMMPPAFKWGVFGGNAFSSFTRAVKDLLIGAGTWFIAFPVTVVVGQTLAILTLLFFPGPAKEQVAVMYVKMAQSYPGLFWIMVVFIVALVPLLEEILFRGFLQTYLRQSLGSLGAILSASAVFALFHYSASQGGSNLEILGSLFVLSCFLGFLFERQASLWASVGLHAFFNLVSIVFLLQQ